MKLEHLSASRIKTYDQCALLYHAKYELEISDDPHPLTRAGSCIHLMFEKAVKAALEKKIPIGTGEADPLFYKAEGCKEFAVSSEHFSLIDELTRNAIQFGYFRNIARTVGIEQEINFKLSDGTDVEGYIDRLDLWNDTADIIDLKTQQKVFEPDELADNIQARVYNVAVRLKYPQVKKVQVSFWVLRHLVQRVSLTDMDAKNDTLRLIEKAASIKACVDPKPTPNKNCKWCIYTDKCPVSKMGIKAQKAFGKK